MTSSLYAKVFLGKFLRILGYDRVSSCTIHCNWTNNDPPRIEITTYPATDSDQVEKLQILEEEFHNLELVDRKKANGP